MRPLRFALAPLLALLLAGPLAAEDLLPPTKSIPEAVDHYIDLGLKEQGVRPAPPADDATLLRRLTLDLVGRIPTSAELKAYLSSADPDKKTKLVDRLLATGGFVRHQVDELDAMLAAPNLGGGRRGGGGSLREYLGLAMKENRPWDRVFRDLILADEKEPGRKGSSAFLKGRVKDLDRLTTDVSVLFFGVNISCAQCHDHPLVPDWKQDHYYGLKSFFAPTYEAGPYLGERDAGVVQFKTTKNVTKTASLMFLTGKVVEAPGGKLTPEETRKLLAEQKKQARRGKGPAAPPPPPKFSARAALAELALQPEQRGFFARAIVNRVWHRLFGMGLVTPIDQMHSENAPSHPELLDWLARDTAEKGYDLKRLIRGLVLSRAYARSSRWEGERWPPPRSFAVARLRALTPMQLATSLRLATTDPDQFPAALGPGDLDRKIEGLESGARGLAALFEQPRDDFQIGVAEALLFTNSDRLQRELFADGRDRLLGRLKEAKSPDEAIDLAVRTVLTRDAAAEEKKALLDYVAARQDRLADAYRQVVWALLTSAEFRFNY
jgi:hypothetical protein